MSIAYPILIGFDMPGRFIIILLRGQKVPPLPWSFAFMIYTVYIQRDNIIKYLHMRYSSLTNN